VTTGMATHAGASGEDHARYYYLGLYRVQTAELYNHEEQKADAAEVGV